MRMYSLIALLITSSLSGEEPRQVEITDPLPYRSAPINYFDDESDDAVAKLKTRIEHGEFTLTNRESSGYLIDLLKGLEIPIESQSLVFSKTSIHQRLVSPKTPRAIYFNDEVSVAWVPGAPVIEIAAQDPVKGAMFYTLAQSTPENGGRDSPIVMQREERCLTCHISTPTLNVPGHLLRSFVVNERGEPQSGYSPVTQATAFEKRWGGWFVTGSSHRIAHLGNLFGADDARHHEDDQFFRGTVSELSSLVDLSKYPSKHSDIVALLVLYHQLHFYNLVTRVRFEAEFDRHSDAEEQLAKYALLEDEAPLDAPVKGSTGYAAWYQSIGIRDEEGRTLRDVDLQTKLFKHGLSPLVRSRSFDRLPNDVKFRLWRRFRDAKGDLAAFEDPTDIDSGSE